MIIILRPKRFGRLKKKEKKKKKVDAINLLCAQRENNNLTAMTTLSMNDQFVFFFWQNKEFMYRWQPRGI
jgi:hypothetical protein